MRNKYRNHPAVSSRIQSPEVYGGSTRQRMEQFHDGQRSARRMDVPSIVGRIYASSPMKLPDRPDNYPAEEDEGGMVARIYTPIAPEKKAEIQEQAQADKDRTFGDKLSNWFTFGSFK